MLVMSFETEDDQRTILDKAIKYFTDTVGLEITEQDPCCVTFRMNRDQVGYVRLTLSQEDKKFKVTLETREFEYSVKKFSEASK